MKTRHIVSLMLFLLVFAAMTVFVTAQTPAPTPTLSPRGMERIFQSLRVRHGFTLNSEWLPRPQSGSDGVLQDFAQRTLDTQWHMPYSASVSAGTMSYDQFHAMLSHVSVEVGIPVTQLLMTSDTLPLVTVGLRDEGLALLYGNDCASVWCNTPQEYTDFLLHDGAMALYALYLPHDGNPWPNEWLIQETFPVLHTLDSAEIEAEETVAYFSRDTTPAGLPIAYYYGGVQRERFTLVFVMVGVGERYTSLMQLVTGDRG